METGVNIIRDSVQLSHQLAEGDNDLSQELLADMEEIKAYIAQIQPETSLAETSNALQTV